MLALVPPLAASALPGVTQATQPAEPALLVLEWRWVTLSAPSADGLHSHGQARGAHTWGTRTAGDAVEPFGPALRLQVGERAQWTLEHNAPVAWVLRRPGGVPIQVPVPLNAPSATPLGRWQLEAQASWPGRRGPVQLQLRWQGDAETIATTVRAAPGRWTAVAQRVEGSPASAAAPEPGVLRSSAAAPFRTRELQVRVSPVLE